MILWILGLSAAMAIALNGTMVMPAIVLAIENLPGYDEGLATAVASAELAGIAVYGLVLARWVSRSGKAPMLPALAAVLAGELLSLAFSQPAALAGARFLAGLGEGAVFGVVTMRLASAPDAERIWGALNFIGGIAMGILLFVVSAFADRGGSGPVFLCVAAFVVLMTPLFIMVRRRAGGPVNRYEPLPVRKSRLLIALIMVALIYAVQAGQWAICGLIGTRSHISGQDIGFYLALSSVLGFAGAAVPALVHRKSLRLPAILAGLIMMAVSLYAFFNFTGVWIFAGAQTLLNIGFYIVTPFVTGLLTEHDRDGSLLSQVLVIAILGAAGGTAMAGSVLTLLGPQGFGEVFLGLLGVTTLAAIVIFAPLHPRRTTQDYPLSE